MSKPNIFCEAEGSGTPAVCTYPQEINLFLGVIGFPAAENTAAIGAALADEYPLANFPDPFLAGDAPSSDEALAQIFTDLVFACNGSDSNIDLARFVPVFGYEFNDPNAPPTLGFGTAVEPPNDVFGFPSASEHAAELQFLFNFGTPLSADEQQLAGEMKTYWGNFVNTGDPNLPRHSSFWLPFNFFGSVQGLRPGPKVPDPFFNFRQEHFCRTWPVSYTHLDVYKRQACDEEYFPARRRCPSNVRSLKQGGYEPSSEWEQAPNGHSRQAFTIIQTIHLMNFEKSDTLAPLN